MKTLRFVALGALALICAQAFAEDATVQPQPTQDATQAVGGSMAPRSEMGSPAGKSRDQVYRELVQSQQNGEAARLQDLYRGGN